MLSTSSTACSTTALDGTQPIAGVLPMSVIGAIGEQAFAGRLLDFLSETCGAEHFAAFLFDQGRPNELLSSSLDGTDTAHRQTNLYLNGQHWRRDPTMIEARKAMSDGGSGLYRMNVQGLPHNELRDLIYGSKQICERVLMVGKTEHATIGLSLLRSHSRGAFSNAELDGLTKAAATLLTLVDRHARFSFPRFDLSISLTSLGEIEEAIAAAPESFPRREAEVCARILYGVATAGIASDLGIGEETVMTYRKRIYQRLAIGSQRELLVWYLRQWSQARGCLASSASGQSLVH